MGGRSREHLLPDNLLGVDHHSDALVKLRRTGCVLGVDTEADPALPALVELPEAAKQQRFRETAASPVGPDTERSDPAASGSLGVVTGRRRDVLAGEDDEPQRRIVIRSRDLSLPPLLERLGLVLPVLCEGLLERTVEGARELRGERLDPKIRREPGLGRRLIAELDRHFPEAAHFSIAATGQQRAGRQVRRKGHGVDSPHAERAKPFLAAIDELRPETAAASLAMDDADCHAGVVILLDPPGRDEPPVLFEQPSVACEIGAGEPSRDVRDAHAGRPAEQMCLVLGEKCRESWEIVGCDRPRVHAGTSASRLSPSPVKLCNSMSGWGSASSPSRLIQIVRRPSADAGAMSWNRLAATCTWWSRSAPLRAKNSSQWAAAGLYEPISDATTVCSNSTPIRASEASRRSRSVFESTASLQPRARASSSAASTSGNGSHSGNERPSASCSAAGAPRRASATANTSR